MIYYFAAGDQNASVARWGPALRRIAQQASAESHPPAVRVAARALDRALAELAALLGDHFLRLRGAPTREIFEGLARDHRVEVA